MSFSWGAVEDTFSVIADKYIEYERAKNSSSAGSNNEQVAIVDTAQITESNPDITPQVPVRTSDGYQYTIQPVSSSQSQSGQWIKGIENKWLMIGGAVALGVMFWSRS